MNRTIIEGDFGRASQLSRIVPVRGLWAGARLFLACLFLILSGAACGRDEAASQEPAAACPGESGDPAVKLELVDEAGEPLRGAALRFRRGEGPWRAWPEDAGPRTVIRGQPGTYQIEVSKPGYTAAGTALEVPGETGEACKPVTQEVTLQMARIPCPDPPAALSITADPPLPDIEVAVRSPGSGRRELACTERVEGSCRQLSLLVDQLGEYSLDLRGLPGLGPMQVVNDVVAYDPPPAAAGLEHRGAQARVDLTGAEEAALVFTVRRDEANCHLADFRTLETTLEPDPAAGEGRPPLSISYQGSLTMTDLGAAACQVEPILTALPFTVELPAGINLSEVLVLVNYGKGEQPATCELDDGRYTCRGTVPNPLLGRPFSARVLAAGQEAIGMQLPFNSMCLIFQ